MEPLHPKIKVLFTVIGVIALCALSFSAGAFLGPRRVEYKERVEFKQLAVEDITKGFTFAKTVNKTIYRNVVTTITDAGTTIVDTSKEQEGIQENGAGNEKKSATVNTDVVKDTSKVVINQPKWRVGGSIGASAVKPWLPITGPMVIGVEGDYRVVGGVFVGLRLNTVGTASLAVSGELP